MKIGKKLYVGFGSILAIVIVLFLVDLIAMNRETSAANAREQAMEVASTLETVRIQALQNRLHLSNYLLSGDSREADMVTTGMQTVHDKIRAATAAASTDSVKSAIARLSEEEQRWTNTFAAQLIAKRKDVDNGNATVADLQIFYLQQNPEEWLRRTTQPLDEALAATRAAVDDAKRFSELTSSVRSVVSMVGTLLALLLGAGIAYFTARSIIGPLNQLMGVAREIGESGDLDQKVDVSREDELGDLARSFNSMVTYLKEMAIVSERIAKGDLAVEVTPRSRRDTLANAFSEMTDGLRRLVTSVRDNAAQVASGSNQVASASDDSAKINVQAASAIDEVTSTMHEMSINVQNMVKNTQVQASSVSETSASIDEMVASIQRVADTAKVLLDISQRSREEVQNGIGTMEKATDGLNRINSAINNSAQIIDSLGLRADDIGKIIEVIDDLAEQTNLLALNAAIEAARAGEHGLGFAVVADEVRKLAEKSAQSTREISDLIQSIQKEARKAVENMEKSTHIVNEGLNLGGDLNLALRKISNVVTEVFKFAQEIGAATNEQSHGSSQIARATTRLNEITHEINSSVEEQASGAQAVVKAMERMRELIQRSTSGSTELAASAEQMSKMSRMMLDSMDRFHVGANANGHGSASTGTNGGGRRQDERPASRYATAGSLN